LFKDFEAVATSHAVKVYIFFVGPRGIYCNVARQFNHDGLLMLQLVETNSNLSHLRRLYSMLMRMVMQSKKHL